jgi:hypothetical protein
MHTTLLFPCFVLGSFTNNLPFLYVLCTSDCTLRFVHSWIHTLKFLRVQYSRFWLYIYMQLPLIPIHSQPLLRMYLLKCRDVPITFRTYYVPYTLVFSHVVVELPSSVVHRLLVVVGIVVVVVVAWRNVTRVILSSWWWLLWWLIGARCERRYVWSPKSRYPIISVLCSILPGTSRLWYCHGEWLIFQEFWFAAHIFQLH